MLLYAAALTLFFVAPATAGVGASGSGEPYYTKGTSNTWWFQWTSPAFTTCENYSVTSYYYISFGDGTVSPTWNTASGSYKVTKTGLVAGTHYVLTPTGHYWCSGEAASSEVGTPSSTTMDASAPTATLMLADGAAYTNKSVFPIHVTYSDSVSPPWRQILNGVAYANNSICESYNGPCTPPLDQFIPVCSVPVRSWFAPGANSNAFDCSDDVTSQSDGHLYDCVRVSDWAVPVNPSSADQFVATGQYANLSAVACDDVVLDRAAPSVTSSATPSKASVGHKVSFTASATDACSGPSGTYSWTFGDGVSGLGASTSHVYGRPGTYVVTVSTSDRAGNSGTHQLSLVVKAAPPPPPPPPPPTTSCKVPNVVGKTLAAATRLLHSAHCTLGKVTRVRSRRPRGRVVSETPAAGKHRSAGARVKLKVSRGRR